MQLMRLHFSIKDELFVTYEARDIFCNIKNRCKMFIAKYALYNKTTRSRADPVKLTEVTRTTCLADEPNGSADYCVAELDSKWILPGPIKVGLLRYLRSSLFTYKKHLPDYSKSGIYFDMKK